MKPRVIIFVVLAVTLFVAGEVVAQDPVVYPAKGQSQEQMEKDKFECYTWAKKQTGFDPANPPQAAPAPERRGGVVRGAAGGALAGAAVGKLAGGSASKGAAWGAAGGGLVGGMRQSRQRQADQQAQQAAGSAGRSEYNRAYGACMEGRGYSVK